jgi:hypoxanthine phosphoribosyltransferase
MKVVEYHPLFDAPKIAARIAELGAAISRDCAGESLVCVGVLKGAVVFLADLIRAITVPVTIEFIGVASYTGTKSSGRVRLTYDLTADIKGKNVLLIEDIIDSGHTIDYLINTLKVREPKSLRIATFLSKPESHAMQHHLDYVGFEISKEFVIGYGLDLDGYYRNLPFLGQVKT